MKVNNLIKDPKWKKVLVCICEGKIDLCDHCKYSKAEKSIPSENFKVIEPIYDKRGKPTGKKLTRTINEINVLIGSHDDVQGWTF